MPEETGPRSRNGCALLMAAYGVLTFGLMAFLAVGQLAASRMGGTRRGWEEVLGGLDELTERFPTRAANETARRIEALGSAMGIDVAPRHAKERDRPARDRSIEFRALRKELGRYVSEELRRPQRGSLVAPATLVATFMDAHRSEIAAVRRVLLEGDAPVWEQDLRRGHAAPLPNLPGQADLQRVLIGSALRDSQRGNDEEALAMLEASWRLNEALRGSPLLVSQQVACSVTGMQAGALRHLRNVPASWLARLRPLEFRERMITAMKYDGWLQARFASWSMIGDGADRSHLVAFVARPYVGLCLSDTSEALRSRVVRLESLGPLCDDDLEVHGASLDIPLPSWNKLGPSFVPDYGAVVSRMARLELDLELTAKVIRLDLERRAQEGRWPVRLPGIEESTACPNDHWRYDGAPDGTMSLSFSRAIAWPGLTGPELPTRFQSER